MKTLTTLFKNNIRECGMLIALIAIMVFFQIRTEDRQQGERQEPGEVHPTAVPVAVPELNGNHHRGRTTQQGAQIFLRGPNGQTAAEGHAGRNHRQTIHRVPTEAIGPDTCQPVHLGHPKAEHRLHKCPEVSGRIRDEDERSDHRTDGDQESR